MLYTQNWYSTTKVMLTITDGFWHSKSKFSHFSGFYQIAILVKINQTWITLKYKDMSIIFTHKYVKTLDYFSAKFIFTVQVSRAHFSSAIVPTSNDSVWKARQPTMRKNLTVPRQLMPKEGKIYAKTTQLLCAPSDPKKLSHIFQVFFKKMPK